MDSLTKENTWNELMELYPTQMKQFCEWIDQYKKSVKWDELFKLGIYPKDHFQMSMVPKFHHLPLALQIGMFFQFAMEQEAKADKEKWDFFKNCQAIIKDFFAKRVLRDEEPMLDSNDD